MKTLIVTFAADNKTHDHLLAALNELITSCSLTATYHNGIDLTVISAGKETQEVPADIPADIPAEVPADIPADIPAEVPADIPADIPAEVPADIPAEVPADIPAEVPIDPEVSVSPAPFKMASIISLGGDGVYIPTYIDSQREISAFFVKNITTSSGYISFSFAGIETTYPTCRTLDGIHVNAPHMIQIPIKFEDQTHIFHIEVMVIEDSDIENKIIFGKDNIPFITANTGSEQHVSIPGE